MLSAYALILLLHMPSFSSKVSALLLMYIGLHPWTVTAIRCSISSSLVTLHLQHCAHFLQSWQPCSSVQSVHGHFILFFLLASAATTYFNFSKDITVPLIAAAKIGFSITLFLIGTGITRDALRKVGVRPMLHGVLLWLIIMSAALLFLLLER